VAGIPTACPTPIARAVETALAWVADRMRPDGSDAITGFMTQLTLTGGFANATLFEQAGVALPGKCATWDDWVNAADKVAKSQGTAAAFAFDRSGHVMASELTLDEAFAKIDSDIAEQVAAAK